MPRKPDDLPEFIIQIEGDTVRCRACDGNTIKRRGLARHLASASHLDSMRTYEENRVAAAAEKSRQSDSVNLNHPPPSIPRPTGNPLFNPNLVPLNTLEELDFNGVATTSSSGARFSAGESDEGGNSFYNLPFNANHRATTPSEPSDDEFPMPLPRRIIQSLANEELNVEALRKQFAGFQHTTSWSPYGSKIMFLLDLIDNIPRLRLSTEHLRLIIWVMEEAGCGSLPSISQLRETQKQLRKVCAINSHEYRSSQGNFFSMINVPQLVGRDYSNPLLAPHINPYPEDSGNYLSESWQAKKWRDEIPLEQLTPMYAQGGKMYYVNELARLHDGAFVIPKRWIIRNGTLTADCWPVHWELTPGDEDNTGFCAAQEIVHVPITAFASNYYDIVDHMPPSQYKFAAPFRTFQEAMPNPLRKLTNGSEELISSFIKPWCDDVSGGQTKQYQPHNNIYLMHANLPGSFLNQEFCIRFASTATHASSVEQFEAIKQQLDANNQDPIRVYNAATGRYVRLRIYILNVPGDNRAQSEVASHVCGGNFPCRKCNVGGPYETTETEAGFSAFFEPGRPRSVKETVQMIQEQMTTAYLGVEDHVTKMQTASGVKDPTAQGIITELIRRGRELKKSLKEPGKSVGEDSIIRRQEEWLKTQPAEPFNVLFQIHGLDPHRDTPVEILHTILLGIEKYAWYTFHSSTKADAHKTFETRLQCADIKGLDVHPIRANYVVRFKNNLIGRHFKMLMQLTVFQVHDLVSLDVFSLIKAVGDLGAVLWYSEITDLELYLADLSILVNNVLDTFTKLDPGRVIAKLKLHILTHLVEDIRNHGPAIRYSTEVFECYNGVFRMCSLLSNHQAPSRDIANKMIELERFRHIACGGYWETAHGAVCASEEVRRFFRTSLNLQTHLGHVEPYTGKQQRVLKWQDTAGSKAGANANHSFFNERTWKLGESVIAKNGDECETGSWVVASHGQNTIIGRILEILLEFGSTTNGIVVIDRFEVAEQRHPIFGMPTLVHKETGSCYETILSCYDIEFAINAQHDCVTLCCPNSAVETIRQERRNTTLERQTVEHRPDAIYVVNMHGLHNARRLRDVLPRSLTEPIPLRSMQAREDFITTSARDLHKKQSVRREEMSKKRKAAREAREQEARADQSRGGTPTPTAPIASTSAGSSTRNPSSSSSTPAANPQRTQSTLTQPPLPAGITKNRSQFYETQSGHASIAPSRARVRRALVIGLCYPKLEEQNRLRYAASDAMKFGRVLKETLQYREADIVYIMDTDSSKETIRARILEGFKRLLDGTKQGDDLIVFFSGHCSYIPGEGSWIITSGTDRVSKEELRDYLVLKVPTGCQLNVVLDCCHSSSLIDLQYCVATMRNKPKQGQEKRKSQQSNATSSHLATSNSSQAQPLALVSAPIEHETPEDTFLQASLEGVRSNRAQKQPPRKSRRLAVVTLKPALTPINVNGLISAKYEAKPSSPTSTGMKGVSLYGLFQGACPPDHLEERSLGFIRPDGNVIVWAAAREGQRAYEAYLPVKNGVMTHAICKALESGGTTTFRSIWDVLKKSIDSYNKRRRSCDGKKPESERPNPSTRIQDAELWVSHNEASTFSRFGEARMLAATLCLSHLGQTVLPGGDKLSLIAC